MTDDSQGDRPTPDLTKAPPAPPASTGPDESVPAVPAAPPVEPAPIAESIWQPLDGSPPKLPQVDPRVDAWGRPHQAGTVPAPHAAAAYAAHAQAPGRDVFTLGGWGARLAAFIIDSLIFGTVGLAIVLPIGLAFGLTVNDAILFFGTIGPVPDSVADPLPLYVVLVVHRIVLGAVPAFFLARWNGQTPGKRALGLRVMRASGEPMTLSVALKRELWGRTIVVGALTLVTIGLATVLNYLWPIWDRERRTGHDAIADTRVVTAPKAR